ncbi:MAG: hypothetical protein JSR57_03510 [Verrucomicrobia bacterium]|nr:hypothetical protein [Verrucomicrobiota bacterium]
MSVGSNYHNYSYSGLSSYEPSSCPSHESALDDDHFFFCEGPFGAESSHAAHASFWNSTPQRLNDPFEGPQTPDGFDDLFDMNSPPTPFIPETPEGGWPQSPELPLLEDDHFDMNSPPTPFIPETPEGGWPQNPELPLLEDDLFDNEIVHIPQMPGSNEIHDAVFR